MSQRLWTDVDAYLAELFAPSDAVLDSVLDESARAGLPPHNVSPPQGKLLALFARMLGARRILEIGTLGGYSTIWLARALAPGGRLITLEANPKHAEVARRNIARAGLEGVVEVRLGPALESLSRLVEERASPFDLVFIDADKPSYAAYFEHAVEVSRPGTVIIADNVVRQGEVANAQTTDASALGVRRFNDAVARDPRVSATAIQTVGSKGHDGFALVWVK